MSEPDPTLQVPPVVDYASSQMKQSRRGKGFLGLAGGLFFPGIGHLVIGRRRRALAWITSAIVVDALGLCAMSLPRFVPALIVLLPLSAILALSCLLDGYLCGRGMPGDFLRRPVLRYLLGLALILAAVVAQPARLAGFAVRTYIVEAFFMPTRSMLPTVAPGDGVLCHKRLPYARWSVMVLREPERGEFVIKRLVGMPGDTIEIVQSVLHINGNPVSSPPGVTYVSDAVGNYHINGPGCEGHPIRLGPDEYYFLGDNSPISADARFWNALPGHQRGALTPDHIIGTVTYTYWPPSRWRKF